MKLTFLCFLVCFSTYALNNTPVTIDFESEDYSASPNLGISYEINGFRFTGSSQTISGNSSNGEGGSNAIFYNPFNGSSDVLTLESIDGSSFDIQSFYFDDIGGYGDLNEIKAYKDGVLIGVQSGDLVGGAGVQVLNTLFDDVDKIEITQNAGLYAALDNFVIEKAKQTIVFNALVDVHINDSDFNLMATTSSGLPITYTSSDPSIASISGNTVTILSVGVTTIAASQSGDANYDSATNVMQGLTVRGPFNPDCSTDFFTINVDGNIQQWSLNAGQITGGTILLTGAGASISFCGDTNSPTFYGTNWPNTGIRYFDEVNGWQNIATSVPVLNNGGYGNAQYYMGIIGNELKVLYYFDGTNLTAIRTLNTSYFALADVAVDSLGRAWCFEGETPYTATSLNVYDQTGTVIASYPITMDNYGLFGAFILNDNLYVCRDVGGPTDPNEVIPITIVNGVAQIGTVIDLPSINHYTDVASCQTNTTLSMQGFNSDEIFIYPNPVKNNLFISDNINIKKTLVYDLYGQLIVAQKGENILNLSSLTSGVYLLHIETDTSKTIRKIIKK